jgi:hypothetical protein
MKQFISDCVICVFGVLALEVMFYILAHSVPIVCRLILAVLGCGCL